MLVARISSICYTIIQCKYNSMLTIQCKYNSALILRAGQLGVLEKHFQIGVEQTSQ